MKYIIGKILQRNSFIKTKGLFLRWFLGWQPSSRQKAKSVVNEKVFSFETNQKISTRYIHSCLYKAIVLQKSGQTNQFAAAAFISFIDGRANENWFKKIEKEVNRFIESVEITFNRFNFCNLSQPVYLFCEEGSLKPNLSPLQCSVKENESGLYEHTTTTADDLKTKGFLNAEVSDKIREKNLGKVIIEELEYVLNNNVSQKTIVNILSNASKMKFEMDEKFLAYFYEALMKLDKYSIAFSPFRKYFWKSINAELERKKNVKLIVNFLYSYASHIKLGKENYWPEFVGRVLDMLKEAHLTDEDMFSVLKSRIALRRYDMAHVRSVNNLVIKNPALVEESIENLYIFLEGSGSSNFHIARKELWFYTRNFILGLQVLENADKWNKAELFYHLNVAKVLALFGIYPKPLLNSLWEKCNSGELTDDCELLNLMILLNQAIYALHPSFNKPFLNENILSVIQDKLEKPSSETDLEYLKFMNEFRKDLKLTLESEIYELDCFLDNCYTKQGLKIDLLIALNEDNEPFSFTKFLNKPQKKIFIEDISLPKEFQLLLIILARYTNRDNRDEIKYDSEHQLKFKCLEAMGYVTVPISHFEWRFRDESVRASHFWKVIRNKNKCIVPENKLKEAREPEMFD